MKTGELVWPEGFTIVYKTGVDRYTEGASTPDTVFSSTEKAFLATLGCSTQELFDLVEDFSNGGAPSFEAAFLVTSLRRDYFLTVQHGKPSGRVVSMNELPSKSAALAGIPWLPRIIEKAKAKLRGEMPPDLMYGCGGDRAFLQSVRMSLPDFLRLVWCQGENPQAIVQAVTASAKA